MREGRNQRRRWSERRSHREVKTQSAQSSEIGRE